MGLAGELVLFKHSLFFSGKSELMVVLIQYIKCVFLFPPLGRSRGAIISQYYNRTMQLRRRRQSRPSIRDFSHSSRPSIRGYGGVETDLGDLNEEGEMNPRILNHSLHGNQFITWHIYCKMGSTLKYLPTMKHLLFIY